MGKVRPTYNCPSIPLGSICVPTSNKASRQCPVSFPEPSGSISMSLGSKMKYQCMMRSMVLDWVSDTLLHSVVNNDTERGEPEGWFLHSLVTGIKAIYYQP